MKRMIFRIGVMLAFLITGSISPAEELSPFNIYKEMIRRMEAYGIRRESIDLFTKALETPDREEFERLLIKSTEADRKNFIVYYALAAMYEIKDEADKAVMYYRKAMEIDRKGRFGTYLSIAEIYRKEGKRFELENLYREATKEYEKVISGLPETARPEFEMALLSLAAGKGKETVEYGERAVTQRITASAGEDDDNDRKKVAAQIVFIRGCFLNGEYKRGFNYFFDIYTDIADLLTDDEIKKLLEIIVSENENIKDTHTYIYQQNLSRFKGLEIMK